MRLYLKQQTASGNEIFAVCDMLANPIYTVLRGESAFTEKMLILDKEKNVAAKISRIGPETFSRSTITAYGKPSIRLFQNMAGIQPAYRLFGVSWRFRGNVPTRSFDLVELDGSLVMSHGVCWNPEGNVFCVDVIRETDLLWCTAISVIIDSVLPSGTVAAVPVS